MSAPARVAEELHPFESWADTVGLTMDEPQPRPSNPWMDQGNESDEAWHREAGHWWVTLRLEGRELSFPFSMGPGHRRFKATARHSDLWPFLQARGAKVPTGPRREGSRVPHIWPPFKHQRDKDELRRISEPIPPTLEELLECMQSDAGGFWDGPTFEEWAGECGYDTDSRRALALYIRCQEHARHITRFLGEHFEPFMEVEP